MKMENRKYSKKQELGKVELGTNSLCAIVVSKIFGQYFVI